MRWLNSSSVHGLTVIPRAAADGCMSGAARIAVCFGSGRFAVREVRVRATTRRRGVRANARLGNASMTERTYTPATAASGVQAALRLLDGRWKLEILFHLFDGKVQRFSTLERLIPGISQKMLAQQLRQLEADGLIVRTVYNQVPPKVEYHLTGWGQALCPALDALLTWAERKDAPPSAPDA